MVRQTSPWWEEAVGRVFLAIVIGSVLGLVLRAVT